MILRTLLIGARAAGLSGRFAVSRCFAGEEPGSGCDESKGGASR